MNNTGGTGGTFMNTARGFGNRAKKSFGDLSRWQQGIFFVLLIIVVGILIWAGIDYGKNRRDKKNRDEPMLVGAAVNAYEFSKPEGFYVEQSDEGLEFTYSFWIFIHDWDYKFNQWKNVFVKGNQMGDPNGGSARAPGIWLYPRDNSLHARINTTEDRNEGCDIKNIPLQKWVHITYILNNRTVDIYVDGKLERSCVLRGVPELNDDNVFVASNGGFMGQLAKLQYFRKAIKPEHVFKIYSQGPYLNPRYRVRLFEGGKFIQTNKTQ